MGVITITPPNKNALRFEYYDVENDEVYKHYNSIVNNKIIAKELYRIVDILNNELFWKHNGRLGLRNIFGRYKSYTKRTLNLYKEMLLHMNEQIKHM